MRRLLIAIGLITLALATTEHASAQTPAVSPAVATILQRVEQGLSFDPAPSLAPTLFELSTTSADWSSFILQQIMEPIDTRVQIVKRAREQFQRTACMQTDLTLLETALETVRQKLNQKLRENDVTGMLILADLYEFLADRYTFFLQGALDPTVFDTDVWRRRMFDTEDPPSGPLCYYHSDYAHPNMILPGRNGYGCDVETMDAILEWLPQSYPVLRDELERKRASLAFTQERLESYLSTAETFEDLAGTMEDAATDAGPQAPAPAREHLTENGCGEKVSDHVLLRPDTGNDLTLLLDFRTVRSAAENQRPLPFAVRETGAMDTQEQRRALSRIAIQSFSARQAEREIVSLAVSTDVFHTVRKALGNFSAAVGKLTALATDIDREPGEQKGLRSFTRDFAFYLMRNCLESACQTRLDRILKIVFTDECFPYANGSYLRNPEHWRECEKEAGL